MAPAWAVIVWRMVGRPTCNWLPAAGVLVVCLCMYAEKSNPKQSATDRPKSASLVTMFRHWMLMTVWLAAWNMAGPIMIKVMSVYLSPNISKIGT